MQNINPRNINPRVDIVFKKIFGVEENKDLLISLVNSIVSSEDQVADLTLLNPYNPQNFMNEKLSILDIKARGLDNKLFNIEIQIIDEADYDKRALYYWGKLYTEQLQKGDSYSKLAKAIGIHILSFLSIPECKDYHNVFHITEKKHGFAYFKDLELHTIELYKFTDNEKEGLNEFVAKIRSSLDMWAAFLSRHELLQPETLSRLPQDLDNPKLEKALSVLEVMNFTYPERQAYEDHLKWLWVEANGIRKARNDALAEGIEIGKAEGKAEGKMNMAKKLLAAGVSVEIIALSSGLSIAEVEKLPNQYEVENV